MRIFYRVLMSLCVMAIGPLNAAWSQGGDFCDSLPRPQYAEYVRHAASDSWFEVYEVEQGIFAIYEPHQWQEVISYLVVGSSSAVLFDTGNGIGDIKAVVDRLTDKKITVVNSHGHIDHVGGNYQFEHITSIATDFTWSRSQGSVNAAVREEASSAALCKPLPVGVTEDNHHIKPFRMANIVESGHRIDIGGRVLELIQIPGHTSDSIIMVDRHAGFMWTGDTYYTGPIWLYAETTDLPAYRKTIHMLGEMAPAFKVLFPAHNVPKADPLELIKVRDGFERVITGVMQPVDTGNNQVSYVFPTFSFLMRAGHPKFP